MANILHGNDVNAIDPRPLRGTALVWASAHGDYDKVVSLLDRDANPNLADALGRTPLHHACHFGFDRMVDVLIKRGADVNKVMHARELRGGIPFLLTYTPLHCAALEGHPKCVHLLGCAGADVSARETQGCTALHLSIVKSVRSQTAVIETLLDSGADVNELDSVGRTPIYLSAAHNASPAAVKLLLDAGGNPNLPDGVGATALSQVQSVAIANMLLAGGASPTVVSKTGYSTPFHGMQGGEGGNYSDALRCRSRPNCAECEGSDAR